jgi:hypothetical protein
MCDSGLKDRRVVDCYQCLINTNDGSALELLTKWAVDAGVSSIESYRIVTLVCIGNQVMVIFREHFSFNPYCNSSAHALNT